LEGETPPNSNVLFPAAFEIEASPPLLMMVALDCSGSMTASWRRMTPFNGAREIFQKFTKKAYEFEVDNLYGLVQFGMWSLGGESFSLVAQLSPIGRAFRCACNGLEASGVTPMWEAIHLAIKELLATREKCPNAPMRIIALTDGSATTHHMKIQDISTMVHENIRFDTIFIGGDATFELDWAVQMTGGYLFCSNTVDDIDPIFQDGAFFDLALRD
jgi:hypothetical protein